MNFEMATIRNHPMYDCTSIH